MKCMNKIFLLIGILTLTLIIAGCPQPGERIGSSGDSADAEMEEDDGSALAGNAVARKPAASPRPAPADLCKDKRDGFELERCPTASGKRLVCQSGRSQERVCPPDRDRDSIPDSRDNCPAVANPNQLDVDSDGRGNYCDDDTVVLQDCGQLERGKTYVLEDNLDVAPQAFRCLTLASDVILDCQGNEIRSAIPERLSTPAIGDSHSVVNVEIRNCQISSFNVGILLSERDATRHQDITIRNVTFRNNNLPASLYDVAGLHIERVNLEDNLGYFRLYGVRDVVLTDFHSLSNDGELNMYGQNIRVERSTICGNQHDVTCYSNTDIIGAGNVFGTVGQGNQCAWATDPTTHSPCPQQ